MPKNRVSSPTRLLVALDGSHLAESVLPLVQTLAKALDAEVTLLHVLEYEPPATVHGEPHITTLAQAQAYLKRVAEQMRASGLPITTHAHTNPERDVAASIAGHAAELNADMIVLAAHGRGGIRQWLVGRIPQQVAARAGRPVLIVPTPTDHDLSALRRILLPMDPAGEAVAALPLAQRLAAACKAELVLVTVVPTPGTMPGNAGAATVFLPHTAETLLDYAEDQARAKLEQLAMSLRDARITVTTDVRRGDPARELVQAITAHGVDLVVMATHARAGLDGLLAGSVGPRVVAAAPCPVLLVPIRG